MARRERYRVEGVAWKMLLATQEIGRICVDGILEPPKLEERRFEYEPKDHEVYGTAEVEVRFNITLAGRSTEAWATLTLFNAAVLKGGNRSHLPADWQVVEITVRHVNLEGQTEMRPITPDSWASLRQERSFPIAVFPDAPMEGTVVLYDIHRGEDQFQPRVNPDPEEIGRLGWTEVKPFPFSSFREYKLAQAAAKALAQSKKGGAAADRAIRAYEQARPQTPAEDAE